MTEEQIKQKAEAEADKVIIGSGMDRASVIYLKHLLTTLYTQGYHAGAIEATKELEKENAELKKVAEFQQSSNMSRYFENKKLKEGFAVGSTFNKALNSMNKNLEEERDKYRNMVFDLQKENTELKEQCSILADCNTCTSACKTENIEMKNNLTKAKEIIKELVRVEYADFTNGDYSNELSKVLEQAEQFLSEVEK